MFDKQFTDEELWSLPPEAVEEHRKQFDLILSTIKQLYPHTSLRCQELIADNRLLCGVRKYEPSKFVKELRESIILEIEKIDDTLNEISKDKTPSSSG